MTNRNPEQCRIVLPIYRALTKPELAIIHNNFSVLRSYKATLVGGHGHKALMQDIRRSLEEAGLARITIETFHDQYFEGLAGYNQLLVAPEFYERFGDCEYILICQCDAIVLNDHLSDWLTGEYAFVGAPMFRGYDSPTLPLQFLATLNGGLSLRHIPSTLSVFQTAIFLPRGVGVRILEKLGALWMVNWLLSHMSKARIVVQRRGLNEDVFWSGVIAAAYPQFRVPTPQVAARFAFEAHPDHLFQMTQNRLPFGCHAFERYDPSFWRTHLPSQLRWVVDDLTIATQE